MSRIRNGEPNLTSCAQKRGKTADTPAIYRVNWGAPEATRRAFRPRHRVLWGVSVLTAARGVRKPFPTRAVALAAPSRTIRCDEALPGGCVAACVRPRLAPRDQAQPEVPR
jgi:hypothetical protein